MDFDLTDDQHDIKRTARDLLASRSSWEQVREAAEAARYDDALWRELCELGWPGIAVAEEHGGQGLGIVELCVLLEELGYACAPTPFLGDGARRRWRSSTPARTRSASAGCRGLASGEPPARSASARRRRRAGARRRRAPTSSCSSTPTARAASRRRDAATSRRSTSIDPTRRHGRVSGGRRAARRRRGGALDRALVAVAAELVGVCQRALDMTRRLRQGAQAVRRAGRLLPGRHAPRGADAARHRGRALDDLLRGVDRRRRARAPADGRGDGQGVRRPTPARAVTGAAIQLHGGIGFTWEADVHWLFKRAQLDSRFLGGGGAHRAAVASLLRASVEVPA